MKRGMRKVKRSMLRDIENVRRNRKISPKAQEKIKKGIIADFAICISFVILIFTCLIIVHYMPKNIAIIEYDIIACIFMIIDIVVYEVAYKKDNGAVALSGLEILIMSIFLLFAPYIFFKLDYEKIFYIATRSIIGYYILKILIYCVVAKKHYANDVSDISNIVKKESSDPRAVQEQQDIMQQMREKRNELIHEMKEQDTENRSEPTYRVQRKYFEREDDVVKEESNTLEQEDNVESVNNIPVINNIEEPIKKPAKTRKRTTSSKTTSTATKGKTTRKTAQKKVATTSDEKEDENENIEPKKTTRGGTTKKTTTKKTTTAKKTTTKSTTAKSTKAEPGEKKTTTRKASTTTKKTPTKTSTKKTTTTATTAKKTTRSTTTRKKATPKISEEGEE